jgi:hypothetical protein
MAKNGNGLKKKKYTGKKSQLNANRINKKKMAIDAWKNNKGIRLKITKYICIIKMLILKNITRAN